MEGLIKILNLFICFTYIFSIFMLNKCFNTLNVHLYD